MNSFQLANGIQVSTTSESPFPNWFSYWFISAFVYGLIDLWLLYRILKREDFDTLNKILWVLVVHCAPIGGVLLYLFLTPPAPGSGAARRNTGGPSGDLSGTPWAGNPGYKKP